jgi:hypothetical protein
MRQIQRTFTVIEQGKGRARDATDIRLPATETVEVIDHLTRLTHRVKAADVSIYRHTLHMHGKTFNLLNVQESAY